MFTVSHPLFRMRDTQAELCAWSSKVARCHWLELSFVVRDSLVPGTKEERLVHTDALPVN